MNQTSELQDMSHLGRKTFAEWFPLGPVPFVILVITLISGLYLLVTQKDRFSADLTLWTFAAAHSTAYSAGAPDFTEKTGYTVDVQLVHGTAVTSRLRAAFWAGVTVPDLVEVEITPSGTFFRGPVEEIGFVDLKPYMEASGVLERILPSRLACYTHQGRIYGLPRDVHPVMLAYRRDLVEELGIDVEELDTWEKFIEVGQRVTRGGRYMMHLEDTDGWSYEVMLYQRGGNYFNTDGELIMGDELAYETLIWFVPLIGGKDGERIAGNLGSWGQAFYKALSDGVYLFTIAPDWRTKMIETNIGDKSGKFGLIPLPAFEEGGRRTSTWGGTMIAITKDSKHPQAAWDLAMHYHSNPETLAARFRQTNIIPPYMASWDDPAFRESRPYWGGQALGQAYLDVIDDTPVQNPNPFLQLAKTKMAEVVTASVTYYRGLDENLSDEEREKRLRVFVRERLDEAVEYVEIQMRRNPF